MRRALAGEPKSHIARELGISRQRVHQICNEFLAEVAQEVEAGREQLRALEVARLDQMLARLSQRFFATVDVDALAKLGNVLLRLANRRAKLLGLDEPVRHELGGPDGDAFAVNVQTARAKVADALGIALPDDDGG